MNVLALVGSTRPDSVNARLVDAAVRYLPSGTTVTRFNNLDDLPLHTEQREANPGASVEALRTAIAQADALIIATPEYNASVPTILKNAIDWASRPREAAAIDGKPVAVLGATPSTSGTVSAREHLVAILTRAGARPLPTTVGIAAAAQAFATGELDPGQAAAVGALMRQLVAAPVAA